jgi:PAS domain S-box-containing protein
MESASNLPIGADLEGLSLRELIEAMDLAVWCSDENARRVIYVSRAYEEIWGRRASEFASDWEAWKEWIHPEDRDRVVQISNQFFQGGSGARYDLTYRIIRPDKTVRTIRDRGFKLHDSPPGVIHGVAVDITDQVDRESQLQENESRLRALIEAHPDMLFVISRDGVIEEYYSHLTESPAFTAEGVVGRTLAELLPKTLAVEKLALYRKVMDHGQPASFEYEANLGGKWRRLESRTTFLSKDRVLCVLRDVTDSWETQERIRQSEELYRSLVDATPDMIAIHQDNKLVFMNESGVRLLGAQSKHDVLGRGISDFVQPSDRQSLLLHLAESSFQRPSTSSQEYSFLRLDGTVIALELTFAVCTFGGKGAIQLIGRDLTQRREAERTARSTEAQLAAIINSRPDWVLAVNREGQILTANKATQQAFEAYTGQPLRPLANPFAFIPNDSAKRFRERLDRAFAGETFNVEQDFEFGERTIHFDISFAPVIESGKVVAVSIVCQDISERVLAQQELAESERRFRSLVEGLRLIAYEFDPASRCFTYVSPLAENLLGYPHAKWHEVGFWRSVLHPEDRSRVSRYALKMEQSCKDHEMEYRMVTADGRTVWIRDIVTVVAQDGIPIRLKGVLIDITENRKLEEQLLQSQKMEAVGRLAGGIAHDFNNMLSAIIGFAELIAIKESLSESAKTQLAGIVKAADRASTLTSQLLTFARHQVSRREIADINELIISTRDLLDRLLGDSISVHLELDPHLALVAADTMQLEQVMLNLALNARDAMPNGGQLEISTKNVHVAGEKPESNNVSPGSYVLIEVSDDGEGMPPEVASRAFEPFFTTKPIGKGTGLGLSVCHGIVANHGGAMRVDNNRTKGTSILIYLPVAFPRTDPSVSVGPLAGHSVLVLNSDVEEAETLRDQLSKLGCNVTVCTGSSGELDISATGTIDVVAVPDWLGESELAMSIDEIKNRCNNVRILYLTRMGASNIADAGSSEEFRLHIPYRVSDLARALESLLANP